MSTNYYLHIDECASCGHSRASLHIGKSSYGWCFSLAVYRNMVFLDWTTKLWIRTLQDWKEAWQHGVIRDEYHEIISPAKMLEIITCRSYPTPPENMNKHSTHGPNNLMRNVIDNIHCIGHGEGPWDYIIGDFS